MLLSLVFSLGKPSKKKNYESVDAVQRGAGGSAKNTSFFLVKRFGQSPGGGGEGQRRLSIVVFVKKGEPQLSPAC